MDLKADAESLIQEAKQQGKIVLFHSGTADIDEQLRYCVEPLFGKTREFSLSNATDEEETMEIIRERDLISFWSKDPEWVSFKVAMNLDKSVGEVTVNDLLEHGQLCIYTVDPEEMTFPEDMLFYQGITDEHGEPTGRSCYLSHESEIADYEIPFGVERTDIYTWEPIGPDMTLTGEDLVLFLKDNYPECNIIDGNLYDFEAGEETAMRM